MTFNANRAGQVVEMINGEVYIVRDDGKFATATVYDGAKVTVTLTGWSETTTSGNTMYQCTNGGWIDLMDGWQAAGTLQAYSPNNAQKYVNEIIKNNQLILQNNLVCARFANKLTASELETLRALQNRLIMRNEALMSDGLCDKIETSYPAGYANLAQSLNDVMTGNGVGVVVSTTVIIVVSAVVAASLGTAAYFAYRYLAQESKDDVRYSKELTRTLIAKLTPEEYEQLKNETAGIVTKARIKQSLSDWGTTGKMLLFAGAAVGLGMLIKKFIKA